MKFCFNWSLVGSTIIEASSIEEAQKKWDAIQTITDILENADDVDFVQHEVLRESSPYIFDEVI